MKAVLTLGLLALALLAGCSGKAPAGASVGDKADFITPGVWTVSGNPDRMFAWAHNSGSAPVAVTWALTLPGGAPLPTGWQATFNPATATLAANGTKTTTARGPSYPDWGSTLITLQLPANQTAATQAVELHAGPIVANETLAIAATRGTVSGPGSKVNVHYVGKFDDGTTFDQGDFPTTLGSGQTVAGFDNGLMGLAVGETATLHIQPAFGYGYDNPPGNYARFNGKTLVFTVTMKSFT